MFDQFSEKAIEVMLLAQEEARRLGHNFVGTEQILLGLIGQETGIAAKVFTEMGVKLDDAQIEVEKFIGRGSAEVSEEIPFTPRAKRVLEQSLQEAEQLGHDYVGTEHLLLGLIREREGVAIRVLENLRIKPPKVRTSVLRMLADEAEKYEEQLLASQKLDNDVPEENNSPQPDSNLGELDNLQPELASNIYAGLSVDPSSLVQAEVEVPDEWEVGDRLLNLYEVTGILGTGGFGKVYKVLHTGWNISLAVKTPQAEQLEKIGGVENFIREAETWVKLGLHPHIVTCFYVRKLGKSPRVFAEFVGGGSLHDWIYGKDGESPKLYQGGHAESLKRILDIAIQFAWGLHYSHEQGLIHQDVKPGNTMMTLDGTVKVTDFGLARAHPIAVSTTENAPDQTLQVEGSGSTPAYRSPEQANGSILTRRTDLYSWALSVLEMFKGGKRWDVGVKVAYAREFYIIESEPLQDNTPPLPQSVAELLWVCLREDPERRARTMLDVANRLKVIYQQETGEAYQRPEPETGKDIADSLNNRAVSLLDLGQIEEAMHLWDRALEVNPLHPESTYNRGLILWRACRITDDILVKDLEKVRDANVENWNAHYLLALVHLERNNCEEAIKSLNQISAAQVQQPEVQEALRLAQERLPNSNRFEKELIDWGIDSAAMSVCITPDRQYGLSTFYEAPKNDSTEAYREYRESHRFYLWDLKTGRVSKSFKLPGSYNITIGNVLSFRSLSLSRDGCYVLVTGHASITGAAYHQLWDIKQGKFITAFKVTELASEQQHEISRVGHLSADDRFVISGNYDGTLEVWDIKTGKLQKTLPGHDGWVNSIDSAPETKFILSGSNDKTLKLWDTATGNCLQTFSDHTSAVQSVCLSADGKLALSGSSDNTLKLWDTSTGDCLRTFIGHTESVQSVYFSPDGKFALSGSFDATLRLWDVDTSRCIHTFIGHEEVIFSICLSADGRTALSGSADTTIRMWSVGYPSTPYFAPVRLCQVIETEKLITINRAYQQELIAAKAALAQGDMLTYAQHIAKARTIPGYERNTELFNAWTQLYSYFPRSSLKAVWEGDIFSAHESAVTSICFSYDGKSLLSGDTSGKLLLWDMDSKQIIQKFQGHGRGRVEAHLSQDGKHILSGSFDKTLKLWNVETGECVRTFEGHTDVVTSICWTSNNRFAISGSVDETIKLWDIQTGHCLRTNKNHKNSVYNVCLSPDERYYLSAKRSIKVWELATNQYLTYYCFHPFYTIKILSLKISPDMEYLLIGGESENLFLLELKTSQIREFKGHTKPIISVCFSPDGRYALSGSQDKTVRFWDTKTLQCLRKLEGHTSQILSVSFSPDMRYALSCSDEAIKIWFLDWELEKKGSEEIKFTYISNFIKRSELFINDLPLDKEPEEEEITQALTKTSESRPLTDYTEDDFNYLSYWLRSAGYGNDISECSNVQEIICGKNVIKEDKEKNEVTQSLNQRINRITLLLFLATRNSIHEHIKRDESVLIGFCKIISFIILSYILKNFWDLGQIIPLLVTITFSPILLRVFQGLSALIILLVKEIWSFVLHYTRLVALIILGNDLLTLVLGYIMGLVVMRFIFGFDWLIAFLASVVILGIISLMPNTILYYFKPSKDERDERRRMLRLKK